MTAEWQKPREPAHAHLFRAEEEARRRGAGGGEGRQRDEREVTGPVMGPELHPRPAASARAGDGGGGGAPVSRLCTRVHVAQKRPSTFAGPATYSGRPS